jgi:hypothetical protein
MSSADTASTIELEDFFRAMAFSMPARMPVTVISSTVSGLGAAASYASSSAGPTIRSVTVNHQCYLPTRRGVGF